MAQPLRPAPDPRCRLAELVAADNSGYAALSRLIGRPDGFLRRFVVDGVPSRLRDKELALLAAYFGIAEQELGGVPAAPPERRPGSRRRDWYEARP